MKTSRKPETVLVARFHENPFFLSYTPGNVFERIAKLGFVIIRITIIRSGCRENE